MRRPAADGEHRCSLAVVCPRFVSISRCGSLQTGVIGSLTVSCGKDFRCVVLVGLFCSGRQQAGQTIT